MFEIGKGSAKEIWNLEKRPKEAKKKDSEGLCADQTSISSGDLDMNNSSEMSPLHESALFQPRSESCANRVQCTKFQICLRVATNVQ